MYSLMIVLKRVRAFYLLDTRTKLLLIEAFIFLGWARILKTIAFSKVAPHLGERMKETSIVIDESNRKLIQRISQVVRMMSRYTLWESMCLVQAIAAMKMLERRQIESTLYLGTAKDEKGKLIAHAWLRSGPFYVTGGDVMHQFTVVKTFAKTLK